MTLPTTMQAVLLIGHGGLDRWEYRTDVPVPQPAAGEVLIRVGASAVNNTDVNTRTGWYSKAVRDETLLRKSGDGRASPISGQTYPTASVTGMPRVV
ncbi:hypothetical protein [Paracoccus sp. JM45]|uniref:hypothetical protein n=1 Tax=Paracoccus sp. JM45 TaxID=2283626 RepID=UPI00351A2683